jgi:hypothetical protein
MYGNMMMAVMVRCDATGSPSATLEYAYVVVKLMDGEGKFVEIKRTGQV